MQPAFYYFRSDMPEVFQTSNPTESSCSGEKIITLYLKLQNSNLMVTFYFIQMVLFFSLSKPVKRVEIVSG